MNLTVGVEENQSQYLVKVSGEIDVYTAPELQEKLLPLTEKNGNDIEVDLANVTYMDSTGLGVFISAYKATQESDSHMKLVHANGRVSRLFKVTGLDEVMEVQFQQGREGQ